MDWGYSQHDAITAGSAELVGVGQPTPAAPAALKLDDPEIFKAQANALPPGHTAAILSDPSLPDADKIALIKELIEVNQNEQISPAQVAQASPAIRDAVVAMQAQKEAVAARGNALSSDAPAPAMVPSPAMPGAAVQVVQLTPPSTPMRPPLVESPMTGRPEPTLAQALDYVRDRGPDATPGAGITRDRGRGLA